MKYEHEIRRACNAPQIIFRALQYTNSTPQGPSYVIAARETFEEEVRIDAVPKPSQTYERNVGLEKIGLIPSAIDKLTGVLLEATTPLIVTSYCGRSPEGFEALRSFAELLAIPVHENAPIFNNFPTTSYLHQGHQWNGGGQLQALAEADVILVIDSDVPWIGAQSRPRDDARVYHLDSDPLKDGTTLWSLPCEGRWKVDSEVALVQLFDSFRPHLSSSPVKYRVESRRHRLQKRFAERQSRLNGVETPTSNGLVTVPHFMARFRAATQGIPVIGLNESTTNLGNVADHLHHDTALSLIGSGGGALGWYSGAAVGAHLGLQTMGRDDLLVAFVGDGTWLFGVPSCAYWMAKRYSTPFVTIIWNNGGWASPKNACLRLHPEMAEVVGGSGLAEKTLTAIQPSPEFGKIAEGAGGAWWTIVEQVGQADEACRQAIRVVKEEKRCAVIEVRIAKI